MRKGSHAAGAPRAHPWGRLRGRKCLRRRSWPSGGAWLLKLRCRMHPRVLSWVRSDHQMGLCGFSPVGGRLAVLADADVVSHPVASVARRTWPADVLCAAGRGLCTGSCWVHATAHDPRHGRLRLSRLRTSAIAISTMVTVSHSGSMVCCKAQARQQSARGPPHVAAVQGRVGDLLAHRRLLARCMPGECGQQRGQLGVSTGQLVLNRVQGLLLPCAEAHYGPFRVSLAARGYASAIARVKEVFCRRCIVVPPVAGNAVITYRLRTLPSTLSPRMVSWSAGCFPSARWGTEPIAVVFGSFLLLLPVLVVRGRLVVWKGQFRVSGPSKPGAPRGPGG